MVALRTRRRGLAGSGKRPNSRVEEEKAAVYCGMQADDGIADVTEGHIGVETGSKQFSSSAEGGDTTIDRQQQDNEMVEVARKLVDADPWVKERNLTGTVRSGVEGPRSTTCSSHAEHESEGDGGDSCVRKRPLPISGQHRLGVEDDEHVRKRVREEAEDLPISADEKQWDLEQSMIMAQRGGVGSK